MYEQDERLNIRVPGGMKSELERIAIREERSLAGQVRYLITEAIVRDYDRRLAELQHS